MSIISRLFQKKKKNPITDLLAIDPSWMEDPQVSREINRLRNSKDVLESEKIVGEMRKSKDPRIKIAAAVEVLRKGLTEHNSNVWGSITRLLADESIEVRRSIAKIYWLREIEYKPHKMDPTGSQSPVRMAISTLNLYAEYNKVPKDQALQGLLCLVDSAPQTIPHHLFHPLMGKYAHVGNRSDIFNWEETQNEMKKRIPLFV